MLLISICLPVIDLGSVRIASDGVGWSLYVICTSGYFVLSQGWRKETVNLIISECEVAALKHLTRLGEGFLGRVRRELVNGGKLAGEDFEGMLKSF